MFQEIGQQVGLDFRHVAGVPGSYFFPEIMAGGAAFVDFDQDGRLDIYLINGNLDSGRTTPSSAASPTNRLYRQTDAGRFVDVTAGSGLDDPAYGIGVAVGDVDNDGFPDVYVTNFGADRLYLNRGDGTFADVTTEAGIDNIRWGASASFLDMDGDGWLDLYVSNYVSYSPSRQCTQRTGLPDYCSPAAFQPALDQLYRNVTGERAAAGGAVRFEDVSAAAGIVGRRGSGLGVAPIDFNDDGWLDIYVANDGNPNFLWINQADGTFRDDAVLQGVAYDAQGRSQAGMGIAVADVDGDGAEDLFVTNLDGETNALYLSGGTFGFVEATVQHGLGIPSYPLTGFGAGFFDADRDGDLDLAVANGRVVRPRLRSPPEGGDDTEIFWTVYAEPNQLFLRDAAGRFVPLRSSRDAFVSQTETSRALCMGDVDNDGDVDLLVANTAGPARLYRNEAATQGHWLGVRAVLPAHGGRDAYGARIRVVADDEVWSRWISPGSSYLSSHDPRAHFGLGSVDRIDRVEVRWPDGSQEVFPGGAVDRLLRLERGRGGSS